MTSPLKKHTSDMNKDVTVFCITQRNGEMFFKQMIFTFIVNTSCQNLVYQNTEAECKLVNASLVQKWQIV